MRPFRTTASANRVVVFDFDGTLVDSNALKRAAYGNAAAAIPGGADLVEDILAANPEGTRHDILGALARRLFPDDKATCDRLADELVMRYTALTGRGAANCPEIPGATAAFAALAAEGWILAINSSTPTDALLDILARRGWRDRFRCVYGAPATKVENLRRIATDLGVEEATLVMVGDREADRRAAAAVGCRFVAVVRPDSDFAAPVAHSIRDLTGLPRVLVAPRERAALGQATEGPGPDPAAGVR